MNYYKKDINMPFNKKIYFFLQKLGFVCVEYQNKF